MTPEISIVIPTYNRPTLLPRAVVSALAACPANGEVIVVDDQSDTAVAALQKNAGDDRLRILTNTGAKGAADARNYGAAEARAKIVLFFDDDDVLHYDYINRIVLAVDQSDAAFGFSAVTAIRHDKDGGETSKTISRKHLQQGLIAADVPLEGKTAAFSAGFWIRRNVFEDVGGINVDQVVDEDTDLCCRLYGLGYRAWYEDSPGCTVYYDYTVAAGSAPQLTRSTAQSLEADCYARTFWRNQGHFSLHSADRWFILRRALRKAARSDADDVARALLTGLRPWSWRLRGRLYWWMKKLGQRLRRS